MDKIAVLIPCYNEAPTIQKVVEDFRKALPEAVVYVYDNNSTDGTADLAEKPAPWCATNTSRARAMSYAACSGRSTPSATSW